MRPPRAIAPVVAVVFAAAGCGLSTASIRPTSSATIAAPVVAWGYDAQGQIDVPARLSGVVAISAGWFHSLELAG